MNLAESRHSQLLNILICYLSMQSHKVLVKVSTGLDRIRTFESRIGHKPSIKDLRRETSSQSKDLELNE
jgi:hypothetical protein